MPDPLYRWGEEQITKWIGTGRDDWMVRASEQIIDSARQGERTRIIAGIDDLRNKVAFGHKPGYKQGWMTCCFLIREIAASMKPPPD